MNIVKRRYYTSRKMARERLKLLLAADRIQCSPKTMELLKEEMAGAVSKYMEVDRQEIDIFIRTQKGKTGGRRPLLCTSIPLKHFETGKKKKQTEKHTLCE